MFARTLVAGLGALLLLAAAAVAPVAAAEPAASDPEITLHSPPGYYLWRSPSGLHLRTHGTPAGLTFTAVLHTNGRFVDVEAIREELRDRVAVLNDGHTLVVSFVTYEGIDGVDFRVRGADALFAAFFTDGHLTRPGHIFLGPDGHHPEQNPMLWRW